MNIALACSGAFAGALSAGGRLGRHFAGIVWPHSLDFGTLEKHGLSSSPGLGLPSWCFFNIDDRRGRCAEPECASSSESFADMHTLAAPARKKAPRF